MKRFLLLFAVTALAASPSARSAPEPELFTPEMLQLRAAISNELATAKARAPNPKREKLVAAQQTWETELAEKRKNRNVRGIAIAESAVATIRDAIAALDAKGSFEFPATLRRELTEDFAKLKAEADALASSDPSALTAAETKCLGAFRQGAARSGATLTSEDAAALARMRTWLTETPPKAKPAAKPGTDAATTTEAAAAANRDAPLMAVNKEPPKEFFAESRPGADWTTVGTWTAEIWGPDVFDIPVYGAAGKRSGKKMNPLVGRETRWTYEAARALEAGDYAFRLRRLDKHGVVDVVDWPTPGNQGTLSVRTHMVETVPAPTGFELQCSMGKGVVVPVKSEPAGAKVAVNGVTYQADGRDATTPFTMILPPGTYAIRITADGFQDLEAKSFEIKEGRQIVVKLQPLKDLPGKVVHVDPAKPWQESGVILKKGERVRLSVTGQWACGSKGEMVGPGGYPNKIAYGHYYLDPRASPRQVDGKPYGALLARIGDGPIAVIGEGSGFIASAGGVLKFDINDALDPVARRDNKGALDVKVSVSAPTP